MDKDIKKTYLLFLKYNGVVSEVRKSKSFFHDIRSYTIHARDEKGWKRVRLAISGVKLSVSETGLSDPILAMYEAFLKNTGKVCGFKKIAKNNGEVTQYEIIGGHDYPIYFRVHRLDTGCFITANYIVN